MSEERLSGTVYPRYRVEVSDQRWANYYFDIDLTNRVVRVSSRYVGDEALMSAIFDFALDGSVVHEAAMQREIHRVLGVSQAA